MFRKIHPIMLLPVILLFLQCSQTKVTPSPESKVPQFGAAEQKMAEASNEFAFDIFEETAVANGHNNLMISPLSISYALGMTYNGANGTTEEAMRDMLAYGDLTDQEVNESYWNLTQMLTQLDPLVVFEIANSIWYRTGFQVEQEFIDINQEYFDARVSDIDFSKNSACDIMNGWIADKTHNKIREVIECPIDPLTMMFLINAIYFNASWRFEFDPDSTRLQKFYLSDGSTVMRDMMWQENAFRMLYEDDFCAVDLPYGDSSFSMTLFLPAYGKTIDDLIPLFNQESWQIWMNSFIIDSTNLYLPKFKFGYGDTLNNELVNLGMGIAFSGGADFTGINKDGGLFISKVIHKTHIQVDEKGTEASAVTVVEMTMGPGSSVRLNKPFLFVIHDSYTGAILFMGIVEDPIWEEG